jgi:hypothetical protein
MSIVERFSFMMMAMKIDSCNNITDEYCFVLTIRTDKFVKISSIDNKIMTN